MSHIIRQHGDANHAQTLTGQWIKREDAIYLASHHRAYPLLHTSMHFCFKDPSESHLGSSTIYCTCGSPAGVFDYRAYSRWQSKDEGEIICCIELMEQGRHATGDRE